MRYISLLVLFTLFVFNCKEGSASPENTIEITIQAREYWLNSGKAELSRYELKQARYGEMHKGHALLVFVSEDFNKISQVKADQPSKNNLPVLKLNFMRRFTTGVYDYSLMSSVFMPIQLTDSTRPLKITTSGQDWCGHIWNQINFRSAKLHIELRSYFENEGDRNFELPAVWTEAEIWNRLKLSPETLPVGKKHILPGAVYLRLRHKKFQAYAAELSNNKYTGADFKGADQVYRIHYPELQRDLEIFYHSEFPHAIMGWKESYTSGWGKNKKRLTSRAHRTHILRLDYWSRHRLQDAELRNKLGL